MSTTLQLLGSALVVAGVALFSVPVAVIVAGVFCILIGLAVRK